MPKKNAYPFAKRVLDVVFSLLFLLLSSPLWILAGLIIWTRGGRPVLIRMENVSEGKPFRMWKFRTLKGPVLGNTKDAAVNGNGKIFFPKPKPETVIPGCRWMRRRHIDELPQFLNVLAGDMAIVGPRPALSEKVVAYPEYYQETSSVRAGITGAVQILGYSRSGSCEEQTKIDRETYVLSETSIWEDMLIILKTTVLVFKPNSE